MVFFIGIENTEANRTLATGTSPDMSIIGLIGSAGKGAVNTSTFIAGNSTDFDNTFGLYDEDDGFTIPDAKSQIYSQSPAGMVVINAASPTTHGTTVSAEAVVLGANNVGQAAHGYISTVTIGTSISVTMTLVGTPGTITLPAGITSVTTVKSSDGVTTYTSGAMADYTVSSNVITRVAGGTIPAGATLLITYAATLVADTDYSVDSDLGTITRLSGSTKLAFKATLNNVGYSYVDSTKVTAANVATAAAEFLNAKARTGITPKILIAPGFTGTKTNANTLDPVTVALLSVASKLRAVVYSDINETTVGGANLFRADFDDRRLSIYYANPQTTNTDGDQVTRKSSAFAAGQRVLLDKTTSLAQANFNQVLSDVTGIDKVIDYNNDSSSTANTLVANNINTVINDNGIRLWGDQTTSTNSAYLFGTTTRIIDYIVERNYNSTKEFLGEPLTPQTIDQILDTVNAGLKTDKENKIILGGEAVVSPTNTPEQLNEGILAISYEITTVKPLMKLKIEQILSDRYTSELIINVGEG